MSAQRRRSPSIGHFSCALMSRAVSLAPTQGYEARSARRGRMAVDLSIGSPSRMEERVKYITIIYGNKDLWQSFTPDEAARAIAEVDAFNRRYKESGELLGAYGLGDELTAKTVRVRNGVPAVTDGPYVEAKEFVSSFFLLDVDSEDRALGMAAEYPFAAHNAVEVWPILHESGPGL